MLKYLLSGAALVALALSGQASAAAITYTATGTARGTIGATSFRDASYTITAIGDTTTVGLCENPALIPGCYRVVDTSTQIAIDGLGTFSITDPTTFFDNHRGNGTIGFVGHPVGTYGNSFFYGDGNPNFSSYDALSSLSLIKDLAQLSGVDPGNSYAVATSGGLLTASGFGPGIFQAVLASSAVPEPAMWLMLVVGFGAVGAVARNRKLVVA